MARPSTSNAFGKCDHEVKFLVDEETHSAIVALAYANGCPVSEYMRRVVHIHVHGHGGLMRAHMAGPKTGQE